MSRISQLVSAVRSTTISADSDGRATIGEEEAERLGERLVVDSFGSSSERSATIARLTAEPDAFATLSAYRVFLNRARVATIPPEPTASRVRVVGEDGQYEIRSTIAGEDTLVGHSATLGSEPEVLVAGDGRFVLYASRGSVGGFEGEGEALLCYDVTTGLTTRVADLYTPISGLREVTSRAGVPFILVESELDGEGTTTTIVDPTRGTLREVDGSFVRQTTTGLVFRGVGTEGDPLPAETVTFNALNRAAVIHNEPDEFGDASLRVADVLAAWDAGTAKPITSSANAAVSAVLEQLRSETTTLAAAAHVATASTTFHAIAVTNEYGHSHTAFAVRQTIGAREIVTFIDEDGTIIARRR